jgi:bis(5'-nucleosidyl)-tetraphosphatase
MNTKIKERKLTTSCGAITWRINPIENNLEILLIKQFADRESWGIPKGHINEGETLEECAKREVREETGVEIELFERLRDMTIDLKNEIKTVVTYFAKPINPYIEPKSDDPDSEVADAKWISAKGLPKLISYQKNLILTAASALEQKLLDDVEIEQAMNFVLSYAPHVDDWIVIKKELLKSLRPETRTKFSTRDPVTKKQVMNDFERSLAERWFNMTGRLVVFIGKHE